MPYSLIPAVLTLMGTPVLADPVVLEGSIGAFAIKAKLSGPSQRLQGGIATKGAMRGLICRGRHSGEMRRSL